MLVAKHNPCHRFAIIAAFEDVEWSIWPDAAVTAHGSRAPVSGAPRREERFVPIRIARLRGGGKEAQRLPRRVRVAGRSTLEMASIVATTAGSSTVVSTRTSMVFI